MSKTGRSSFFELLLIYLREDYRFPVLEIFAALFVLVILYSGSLISQTYPPTQASMVQGYLQSIASFSFIVFLILIWKNLAAGFGGDFEKGIAQTFHTYPVSRRLLLLGRLLSSVGVALAMLLLAQSLSLLLLAPGFFASNLSAFVFAYIAGLGNAIFITAIVLLVAVLRKTSGSALTAGIALYFGLTIALLIVSSYAQQTGNADLLIASFILNPISAFQKYYPFFLGGLEQTPLWSASFGGILAVVLANYAISAVIVALSFLYFTRRLEP